MRQLKAVGEGKWIELGTLYVDGGQLAISQSTAFFHPDIVVRTGLGDGTYGVYGLEQHIVAIDDGDESDYGPRIMELRIHFVDKDDQAERLVEELRTAQAQSSQEFQQAWEATRERMLKQHQEICRELIPQVNSLLSKPTYTTKEKKND